nr:MAG TPA: hypothetical protein [Caudoviricetes sp.]
MLGTLGWIIFIHQPTRYGEPQPIRNLCFTSVLTYLYLNLVFTDFTQFYNICFHI